MIQLKFDHMKTVNEVFKELGNLRRWSSYLTEGRYNELSKQTLNCVGAYILASYCEESGQTIHWELFPKIAMYRAFQKTNVYFDRPEHIIDEVCMIGGLTKEAFFEATRQIILEKTDKVFSDFICEGIGTYEMRIYRVATKIATLVEIMEIQSHVKEETFISHVQRLTVYLENYLDMPGVKSMKDTTGPIFKLLRKISEFRNQIRWAVRCYVKECSVLGHSFDTALFGYFSALEIYQDEKMATKLFEMGLFHDMAEIWTGDFPSPIKKYIPGLRAALNAYEEKMLEENFYSCLPIFISKKIRALLEEAETESEVRRIFKGADNLSAESECDRQYQFGSRDAYFFKTPMKNFQSYLDKGSNRLSETCYALHCYFYEYARRLNLES